VFSGGLVVSAVLQVIGGNLTHTSHLIHQGLKLKLILIYFGIIMINTWRMIWARRVARMGGNKYAHGISVGKPEGKKPLKMPRRR
jgi:hypothetical protein